MATQLAGSYFTWVDYSERERRRARDVIDLFREQDTRDELGIGTVRDAFADLLFPGTTTIQTRAKYFLFVPWTYLEMERLRVPSARVAARSRQEEDLLMDALLVAGDSDGVIGKEARAGLKRPPSNIYWSGLRSWGIRRFQGSQEQYHRSLGRFYRWEPGSNPQVRNDDGEPLEGTLPLNWDPGIPPRPPEFPRRASLRLSAVEANYLRERILTDAGGSLLAFLVEGDRAFEPVRFPWSDFRRGRLPLRLDEQLLHARNFSEVMHGAALLFNLMLAELRNDERLVKDYRGKVAAWSRLLDRRAADLASWDRARFWEVVHSGGARVPLGARAFVDTWLDLIIRDEDVVSHAEAVASSARARRLISARERAIKGGRARLHSPSALQLWSGAAGTARLTYRWAVAQQIIRDIVSGLAGEDDGA